MDIYTDGSFNRKITMKASGWASIFILEIEASGYILDICYGAIDDDQYTKMWNVGGEIFAVTQAIDKMTREYPGKSISIYHDYSGISEWANGRWRAKNAITLGYQNYIKKKRTETNIDFHLVKGHSGNLLNNIADFYAKKGLLDYVEKGISASEIKNKFFNFDELNALKS